MNGRPLITWAIDVALASGEFSEVVVSTDDEEIAEVARMHGASVPFLRPATLADDLTPTINVVAHALLEMQTQVYWGRVVAWRAKLPILPNAVGYEIGADRAIDIDTEGDWARAEFLHAASRR